MTQAHLKVVTKPHFKWLLRQFEVTLQKVNLLIAYGKKKVS